MGLSAVWARLTCCRPNSTLCIDDRHFVKLRRLAEGGFSIIYLVQEVGGSRERYALKHMVCHSREETARANAEVALHKRLAACPHVLALEAHSVDEETDTSIVFEGVDGGQLHECEHVYLVLPFYPRGTLQDELERRLLTRDYMPLQRILRIFDAVCSAVHAMHALEPPTAHRDIKAANVLLATSGEAVLMDLGSAGSARVTVVDRKHAQRVQDDSAELCTMTYRAPELFNVVGGMVIDERVDVWSLGCLLYALMFFRSPFDMVHVKGNSVALAVAGTSRATIAIPDDSPYPSALIDLVFEMMAMECGERPYVDKVLEAVRGIEATRLADLPHVA